MKATSPSHPLLTKSSRSASISSDVDYGIRNTTPNRGQPSGSGIKNGDEAEDSLSGYSHLVVEEDLGRSRYYGAASSVYLTASTLSTFLYDTG